MAHPTRFDSSAGSASVVPAMVGLDVGDRSTHFCALDEERRVVERGHFTTTRESVREFFGVRAPLRVVLEAGSQSPWLSAELRAMGHEVHVVDPRRIALIAKGHRKTDRRDAEVLARLALGMPELLGEVHHRNADDQADVATLRARDLCVRMRTKCVQHVRGTLKAFGIRMRSCSTKSFHRAVRDVVPETLQSALEGVLSILADPERFSSSRKVGSWIGLAPRVHASGDQDPQLSISKTGDGYLRRLLVQSAQYILGPFGEDCDLRRFGMKLVERGGKAAKRRAITAVARKLAVLLHQLWVRGEPYDPFRQQKRLASAARHRCAAPMNPAAVGKAVDS